MAEKEFLEGEASILAQIEARGREAREKGLEGKVPEEGKQQTGYIVYLTHDGMNNREIHRLSGRIYDALGGRAVRYGCGRGAEGTIIDAEKYLHSDNPAGGSNVHTTLATYNIEIKPIKAGERGFRPDGEVVIDLSLVAQRAVASFCSGRSMDERPAPNFNKIVHDEGSVIALPDNFSGFYEIMNLVVEGASQRGIGLKRAWGRHTSVARVKENIPVGELEEFKEVMGENGGKKCLGGPNRAYCPTLNVGWFSLQKDCFKLQPLSVFPFF